MKIGDDYKIEGDNVCLMLYKRRVVESGKNKGQYAWSVIGNYNAGRYDHVLERLVDMEVSGLEDLEKVAMCCDTLKDWIRDALKNRD